MFKNKKVIIICLLVVALLSMFGGTKLASPKIGYASTIEALDEKKETVIAFSLTSAAASVSIAALGGGDSTTPIADKFADLSSYFLIVLCAIFFQKYLLGMTGFISFGVLIPIACLLGICYVLVEKQKLLQLASKIALSSLVFACIIPVSVVVGETIEITYNMSKELSNNVEEIPVETPVIEEEQLGIWDSFVKGLQNGITAITSGAQDALDKFKTEFISIMEALAVLIVTSCVIPIAVMYFFVKLLNIILGLNIDITTFSKKIVTKRKRKILVNEE